MDKEQRNTLKRAVEAARILLEQEVQRQLEGVYNILPNGEILDNAPGDPILRSKLLQLIKHHQVSGIKPKDAVARVKRESAFTILNRFVALRLAESRGLVRECVSKGVSSSGVKELTDLAPGLKEVFPDSGYRLVLESIMDELSLELKGLFERRSPNGLLWPGPQALKELLEILNSESLSNFWEQDETIGWVYQYFNSTEERKAMRDASQAPRNSRELAIRNQFFTPRYVVEFLTDNTLGRTWHEMRKGNTILAKECRYLARRTGEVFLRQGEKAPTEKVNTTEPSQKELLEQPVYIEHRPQKDPRDLRVLDPACGSGHFLLYAFDLLVRIYEEAWNDPESPKSESTGQSLQEDFETLDDLRREAPKLIIEHNLHGIDIDPRAVQIAALALWLRAQKTWKHLNLKAGARPHIAKSNIVTAEPMPGEGDLRREFTSELKPRVLGQIVDGVFEQMKLAGEAGSLLRIEKEIIDAVAAAQKQWRDSPNQERQLLFPGLADPPSKQLELRFDVKGITNDRFWEQAEDRILGALKDYAEKAENSGAIRRRLFAEDASRGFAFIDLCRKRYDVALMNPPFGLAPRQVFDIHKKIYTDSHVELYAQMVTRGLELLDCGGSLGAISSRSFMTISRLRQYRRNVVLPGISLIADLGASVMDDAFVESSAYVITKLPTENICAIDLRSSEEPHNMLLKCISNLCNNNTNKYCTVKSRKLISDLPDSKILYSLPIRIHELLGSSNVLEPDIATVRQGMGTFDDFRFLRLRHESHALTIGRDKWEPLAKGGAFAFYYSDIHLLLNWRNDGSELSAVNFTHNGQDAQVRQASEFWRRPGATYSKRSQKGFSARALPSDCIIAGKGPAILTQSNIPNEYLLGWINSRLIRWVIEVQANDHEYNTGILKTIPWISPQDIGDNLILLTKSTVRKLQLAQGTNDTNSCFLPTLNGKSLKDSIAKWHRTDDEAKQDLSVTMASWDEFIDQLYGVDSKTLRLDEQDDNTPEHGEDEETEGNACIFDRETAGGAIGIMVGFSLGQWDIRIARNPLLAPKLQDPFAPLPICPPGRLVGQDGLPAEPNSIVSEEWLRERPDAISLPQKNAVNTPTIPDSEYPIRISWDGVLVDDPGFDANQPHRDDIIRRVREVFEILWKDKGHEIEQEACDLLDVSDLRDYFRRPAGFFQDHLKRYSKSRRKAPIYWPLSTASGSYTIWLYYHRLSNDILLKVVSDFVTPKINSIEDRVAHLEGRTADAGVQRELSYMTDFAKELREFRLELVRVADLPYKPNLNDGVQITAAPLWKLFQLTPWRNALQDTWKKLEAGEFDWAHLAYALWPDRVREKCKKDRSLSIAHGLEEICTVEPPKTKTTRGRKKLN